MEYKHTLLVLSVIVLSWISRIEAKCDSSSECGKYGYCGAGNCICRFGHIGDDCHAADADTRPSAVIGLQIFLGILYGTFSLLCFFGLYHSVTRTGSSVLFISNVQKIIFGVLGLSSFLECLYVSIDPLESWGPVVNPLANNMLWTQIFPAQIFCYSVLLFHWIELVNISVETMKKEYMLQKINMNYRGKEVTVEDMVEKVKTLNKMRIPFAAVIGIVTALLVGSQIAKGLNQQNFVMNRILFIVVVLCWLCLTIGFMVYGRRLVGIMPYQLAKRAKKLTLRLSIVSCFNGIVVLVFVSVLTFIQTSNADADLVSWGLAMVILWLMDFAIASVYLHWSKTWPFIAFSSRTTKSNTSKQEVSRTISAQQASDGATIDVEVEL